MKYIIENTVLEEKETFLHISNYDETVELCTTDKKVFKRLCKKLGEPTQVFPPTKNKDNNLYISGASWKYNYFTDRDKLKQLFSITNLLSRKKGEDELE